MSALNPERLIISTDVETLGGVPGLHPLLSMGFAAINFNEEVVDTFEANLEILPGYKVDWETAAWWADPAKREAWKRTREAPMPVQMAFAGLVMWLDRLKGLGFALEFLAKPAGFDIGWLQQYCFVATGHKLLPKWRSWDVHTLIAAFTGKPVTDVVIQDLPEWLWKDLEANTRGVEHVGVDDAVYQGKNGVRLIKAVENACKWAQIKELETV